MNIYKISQSYVSGWDTYDSAVVVAKSEVSAKEIHPAGGINWCCRSWSPLEHVKVELLAKLPKDSKYKEGDVICSSFNAG